MLRSTVARAAFVVVIADALGCSNGPFDNPAESAAIPQVSRGLMVDDFDDGRDPNLLGYCSETFAEGAARIVARYSSPSNALRSAGAAREIIFDVTGGGDPFGGYVETLTGNNPCPSFRGLFNVDSLNLRHLTFWARSDANQTRVEVAFKDIADFQTSPKPLVELSTTWRQVRIHVSDLLPAERIGLPGTRGTVNLQQLREVNFGFAKSRFSSLQARLSGTVYVDEIGFEP